MTQANLVTDRTSSQGFDLVNDAKKVSIKATRNANAKPQLDSSNLLLAHGATRTYVDGLTDNGPSGSTSGKVVTVTAEGFGTKPATGETITAEGLTCKCMESQYDDNVGELRGWSATYTSDFPST